MPIHPFISVDWGTTNFRLRLVEIPTLNILEERTSPHGVKHLYQQSQGGDREGIFLQFLLLVRNK